MEDDELMELSAFGLDLHRCCNKGIAVQWPWSANHLMQILGWLPRIGQAREENYTCDKFFDVFQSVNESFQFQADGERTRVGDPHRPRDALRQNAVHPVVQVHPADRCQVESWPRLWGTASYFRCLDHPSFAHILVGRYQQYTLPLQHLSRMEHGNILVQTNARYQRRRKPCRLLRRRNQAVAPAPWTQPWQPFVALQFPETQFPDVWRDLIQIGTPTHVCFIIIWCI
ncbi:hypothetical protein F4819DRAFT_312545 [Hypoxylon fuscum]|nr:hypothetical protein F4819DRAFT_312545 [Hypoxylon fuscum]